MARAEHTITIDAPPQTVWAVFVDVERWHEWNGSIRRIERRDTGDLAVGSRARIALRRPPASSIWEVTELTPRVSFTWESRVLPGATLVAGHTIAPEGAGARATISIEMRGPLSAVVGPLFVRASRSSLKMEAEGLKRASESRAKPD